MRVLLAEDERDLNDLISRRLIAEGYGVDRCFDGQEALDFLQSAAYDAVILDIMMPRVDGLTVLRRLRAAGNRVPLLLLTARDAVADRVAGLDAGANDYLVKPFAPDELCARLRVLTRAAYGAADSAIRVGDLCVDTGARRVTRGGAAVELSAREYALLEYLAYNAGAVLSREQIENHVWNFDYEGGTNVVDVYIRYLRQKIDEPFKIKTIHTIRAIRDWLRGREAPGEDVRRERRTAPHRGRQCP